VVNPDSGRPIVFEDERLLHDDFGKQERFAETLDSVALCGAEKTKPRKPFYSPPLAGRRLPNPPLRTNPVHRAFPPALFQIWDRR